MGPTTMPPVTRCGALAGPGGGHTFCRKWNMVGRNQPTEEATSPNMQQVPTHRGRSLDRRGRLQPRVRMWLMLPTGLKNLQSRSTISFKLRPQKFSIAAEDVTNAFPANFLTSLQIVLWKLRTACVRRSCIGVFRLASRKSDSLHVSAKLDMFVFFAFTYVISVLCAFSILPSCTQPLNLVMGISFFCWFPLISGTISSLIELECKLLGPWAYCASWNHRDGTRHPTIFNYIRGGFQKFAEEGVEVVNAC